MDEPKQPKPEDGSFVPCYCLVCGKRWSTFVDYEEDIWTGYSLIFADHFKISGGMCHPFNTRFLRISYASMLELATFMALLPVMPPDSTAGPDTRRDIN